MKRKPSRLSIVTNDLYNDNIFFSPDAPPYPELAPVAPRATPYTEVPLQCSLNLVTGTVRCVNNESRRGLYSQPWLPNANYVTGEQVVREPPDSPLNRILSRPPTGPWELVGAAVSHGRAAPEEKTMLVYAQTVDSARDRYNYRVVDSNNVPLDIGYKVHWKGDSETLHIPGYGHHYKLLLYSRYR